jgi:predicted transcriptional regulator
MEGSLLEATTIIVVSLLNNPANRYQAGQLPGLIQATHEALLNCTAPPPPPKPVIDWRATIYPDYLVSLIDGSHFKVLTRHIRKHGYTDESYRVAFGLPNHYPMVAADYSKLRMELAIEHGLGHRRNQEAA